MRNRAEIAKLSFFGPLRRNGPKQEERVVSCEEDNFECDNTTIAAKRQVGSTDLYGAGAPSATTSTKDYLKQQIAEREKNDSALSTSQKSLFQHTEQEKLAAMEQARGELQVSSDALLRERMTALKIDSKAPGGAAAEDKRRNMSKGDVAKIN